MKTSAEWLAAAGTWIKMFVATVLASFLTLVTTTGSIPTDGKSLQAVLVSGLVSVLPVVITALNKNNDSYGMGFKPSE